ncbi:response regulator transcription factor [Phenylobacterium terrae]|uniref:Response regulator transcription factor n=1 Tax=Phenylobacterium terrae TaxID=2665495 RepID=A0ABW4N1B8_9CAUL
MSEAPVICVVEDDESLRTAVVGLLRSYGYRARGFPSAEAFLETRATADCGCIVADIQLPGLSGLELKARLDQLGARTPVILVTARTEPAWLDKAQACGALSLLSKPFAEDALLSCVRRALGETGEPA